MANNRHETAATFHQQAKIVQQLCEQFEHLLEPDIVESVIVECNYDAALSRDKLGELTGVDVQENTVKKRENPSSSVPRSLTPVEYAKEGYRVIFILRGLPGSGKSTLGKQLLLEIMGPCIHSDFIYSADDYFLRNGEYRYNQSELREAHAWTQKLAKQALHRGKSPIFIDNTNTQIWEMRPYCEWAVEYGYIIAIVEPRTDWAFRVGELSRRGKHRVPRDKIQDMLDRYEPGITTDYIFKAFGLSYRNVVPPLLRNVPPIIQPDLEPQVKQTVQEKSTKDVMTTTSEDGRQQGRTVQVKQTFVNHGQLPPVYPKGGHFDKGTMTKDSEDYENMDGLSAEEVKMKAINFLAELFEGVPRDYLEDILQACGGDMAWCINILSEDNKVLLDGYEAPKKENNTHHVETAQVEEESLNDDVKIEQIVKVGKPSEEQKQNMKKYLESGISINPEHYGPNAARLKRFAEVKPSTSHQGSKPDAQDEGFILLETDQATEDSSDFEDTISEDSEGRDHDANTIEINFGPELIQQLKLLFGDPGISGGYSPIVEIPRELGKQLHALYYESMLKQMEAQQAQLQHMLAEDEEMQMKLQLEEIRKMESGEDDEDVPNLSQIMKDQAEAKRMQKIADNEWRNLTPDKLAYRMTIQKLEASFPKIPVETLTEVYYAYEGNFEETMSSLRDSGAEYYENVKKTISATTLKEMKDAHDQSEQAHLQDQQNFEEGAVGVEERTSSELRAEAQEYQKRRDQLRNRAKEYYNKGMTEVATFYSDLARKQTRLWEKYNSLAAVQIVSEGFNRNNDSDTIDLHFLHVPEALNLLDIYIDKVINSLQVKGKSKDINVITGRGKNSPNGIPKIRPSVEQRLKKRKLRFNRVNPGLLKVKILKTSLVTAALE